MFVGIGVGGYSLGIFHLFTHAFFKALLFLGAGSVIHAMHHEQDMRRMGGLRKDIPITFWAMIVGTISLTGFPLTSGNFSKDAIIDAAFAAGAHQSMAVYAFILTTVAVAFTSFYSWRLIFMTFFGERHLVPAGHDAPSAETSDAAQRHDEGKSARAEDPHGTRAHDDHAYDAHDHVPHESPWVMLIPLIVLSIGALFAGLIFAGPFVGHGYEEFWKGSLYQSPDNHILHELHDVGLIVEYLPLLMMAGGAFVAWYMYIRAPGTADGLARANPLLYRFLLNKWYFDELYDLIFVRPAFWIGRLLWRGGDERVIDGFGPDAIAARVIDVTNRVVRLQTGYVYHYAFAMLIGVAVIITWYLVGGVR
jgi:NADH-quinone oxidoreductase subunit L